MHVTRYKRQVFLFLAAILIPAAVLVGLASRILYPDRELGAKRAAAQRRIAIDQLRRELDAHLEAIKLQEINRLIRALNVSRSQDSDNPAVVFTANVQGDRCEWPAGRLETFGSSSGQHDQSLAGMVWRQQSNRICCQERRFRTDWGRSGPFAQPDYW